MSISCFGCFPYYQANQLAHMDPGGCLYCDDSEEMICPPTNLESAFDAAAAKQADIVECCICYEIIGEKNNCVTECGHRFCFGCLLKAMTHNTACPCCRTELYSETFSENSEEEESEYEDDEEEDSTGHAHIEDIVERLEKEGVTMLDVVSMLLDNYSTKDAKYTPEYIETLNRLVYSVENDVEHEAQETRDMAAEDKRDPA